MNQKDLIKYGLIALGAYLIYRYIQDHGGIDGLFGTPVTAGTHPAVIAPTTTAPGPAPGPVTQPTNQTQQIPVLDMTGLIVTPDVNGSFSGTVRINGVPIRLSIITSDGRIFGAAGTDITQSLQNSGVDVVAIRTAFLNAAPAPDTSVAGLGWTNPWTM